MKLTPKNMILIFLCCVTIGSKKSRSVLASVQESDDDMYSFASYLDPIKRYISHEEMLTLLFDLQERFPYLCELYKIGVSVEGRELWVARITDTMSDHDGLKPMVKYIGNMHGNEAVSRQMMLQLIIELLLRFDANDHAIRSLLKTTEIHILPTMNPDGFSRSIEGECSGDSENMLLEQQQQQYRSRQNANGVDLNRDFPLEPKLGNHQPETIAVMNWTLHYPFALSANFHGGALLVSYLYDHSLNGENTYNSSPDDKLSRYLASVYSSYHAKMNQKIQCSPSDPAEITNGAEWYAFNGSLQDFTYLYSNCIDLTVELSCCKHPHRRELMHFWRENRLPLLRFIEAVHMGIKGFVVDADTGEPIRDANIRVQGNAKISKTDASGRYWRLLLPDQNYNLSFSAAQYETKVFEGIRPNEPDGNAYSVMRLDVELKKIF